MLLAFLEIGMLIAGIVTLVKGRIALTRTKVVVGPKARVVAGILMLPAPLAFSFGVMMGFLEVALGMRASAETMKGFLTVFEMLIFLGCLGLALALGFAFAQRPARELQAVGSPVGRPEALNRSSTGDEPPADIPLARREDRVQPLPSWMSPPPSQGNQAPVLPPRRNLRVEIDRPENSRAPLIFAVVCVGGVLVAGTLSIIMFAGLYSKPDNSSFPGESNQVFVQDHRRPVEERRVEPQRKEIDLGEENRRREERRQENARLEEERRQERERQAELEALRIERLQRERLPRLSKPLAEVTIPAAKFEVGSLVVNRKKEEGLTWAMLPLDGPVDDRPDPLRGLVGSSNYVGVCWAADGQSFFVLSRNGVLRRIGYPGLMVMAEVKFNQDCQSLEFCKHGLLATLGQLQELWIVNPDSLAVDKRIGISQPLRALTGPRLAFAYVFCREPGSSSERMGLPIRVNLEDGTFAAMTLITSLNPQRVLLSNSFAYAALSPDGRWLFANEWGLVRCRIEDTKLISEEKTNEGMGGGSKVGICISPDSQWVCFPTGGGNDDLKYGTYIYRTNDLSRPAFTIHQGAYPSIVGFDPVTKRLFSQNFEHPLIVFDQNGTSRGQYQLWNMGGTHKVRQYAARPTDGRVVLMRVNLGVVLIEFDGAG